MTGNEHWLPAPDAVVRGALKPWRQVADHADSFFARAAAAHGEALQCGPGCTECCQPTLNVLVSEALAILLGLSRLEPALVDLLRQSTGEQCCLLHPGTGRCAVYRHRPLICRTHGLPLLQSGALMGQPAPDARISCCPLNFQGSIPRDATLNAALLSAQLLVANSLVLTELGLEPGADRISVFRLLDAGLSALAIAAPRTAPPPACT